MKGSLYAIAAEGSGLVKVGWSKNVSLRLSLFQCGCPLLLSVAVEREMAIKDPRTAESEVHGLLSQYRQRGEWFDAPLNIIQDAIHKISDDETVLRIPGPVPVRDYRKYLGALPEAQARELATLESKQDRRRQKKREQMQRYRARQKAKGEKP